MTFNTFIPEKTMTPAQRKLPLKSFAKFADAFTSKDEIKRYFNHKEDSFINNRLDMEFQGRIAKCCRPSRSEPAHGQRMEVAAVYF